MNYLIQMRLATNSRPNSPQEGLTLIEGYIFPTLEMYKKLEREKKILAGGPMSAAIGIVLIAQAESAPELDDLLMSLPLWPLMETTVTPLTTFDGRIAAIRPVLEGLKASLKK